MSFHHRTTTIVDWYHPYATRMRGPPEQHSALILAHTTPAVPADASSTAYKHQFHCPQLQMYVNASKQDSMSCMGQGKQSHALETMLTSHMDVHAHHFGPKLTTPTSTMLPLSPTVIIGTLRSTVQEEKMLDSNSRTCCVSIQMPKSRVPASSSTSQTVLRLCVRPLQPEVRRHCLAGKSPRQEYDNRTACMEPPA